MKRNVGGIDKILRIVIGALLMILAATGTIGWWGKHHADILGADGHFDTDELLYRQAIGLFVDHHGNIIQAVHIRQGLQVSAGFGQFFGTAVQQADMRVGTQDGFTVQLQYHAQYAVRRRVLRAEVDGVVS